MRERGQIFTTDMAFAVMLLGVVLFISAGVYGDAMEMTRSYVSRHSLERRADDIADALVKTPGTPANWEENLYELETPGFAKIDERDGLVLNYIDFRKVGRLSSALRENNWNLESNEIDKSIEETFGDNKFEIVLKRGDYSRSFWPGWDRGENFPEARVKSPEVVSVKRFIYGMLLGIRGETAPLLPPPRPAIIHQIENFEIGFNELEDWEWYVYVENTEPLGRPPNPPNVSVTLNYDPETAGHGDFLFGPGKKDIPGSARIDVGEDELDYGEPLEEGQNFIAVNAQAPRHEFKVYVIILHPDDDPVEIPELIKERPYTLQVRVWR